MFLDLADPADRPLRGGHTGLVVGEQVSRSGGGVLVQTRRYQMSRQLGHLGCLYQFELASALDLVGTPGQFRTASCHGRMVQNRAKAKAERTFQAGGPFDWVLSESTQKLGLGQR